MTDKERIAELEAAVEWVLGELDSLNCIVTADALRARAFPPKFEEVEVKCWIEFNKDGNAQRVCNSEIEPSEEGNYVSKMTGTRRVSIPAKVRHRKEISPKAIVDRPHYLERAGIPFDAEIFAEWEE